MEGVAAGHATPVLQADPLQPLPLGKPILPWPGWCIACLSHV